MRIKRGKKIKIIYCAQNAIKGEHCCVLKLHISFFFFFPYDVILEIT